MFTRNLNADKNKVFKKVKIYGDGRCLFRCFASELYQPSLLCNRHNSGAPVDPRLSEKERKLGDLIRRSAVDLLQINLPFFNYLDVSVLEAICNNFPNFRSKLEAMRKTDEYAGEAEIIGIIYGAHCPVYVYKGNEHNKGFTCAKYWNDTFPDVGPIRLLYTPETDSSSGHYDLLVTQHDIMISSNSVIDLSFENTGEIFQI